MKIFRMTASSLLNTVYVCLVVAIFCGVLIFISQSNSFIFSTIEESNKLIYRNKYDVALYLAQSEIDSNSFDNNGITTEFKQISWGFYKILNSRTFGRNRDTLAKSFFLNLGENVERSRTAVYLKNNGEPLKYSGTVKIEGDLYIPQIRLKPNFVKNTKNRLVHNGSIYKSKTILPSLETDFDIDLVTPDKHIVSIDEVIEKGRLVNSFDNPTIWIKIEREMLLKDLFIKGNIVIYSTSHIILDNSLVLTDIILKAPEITVNRNFEGVVQLESERLIEIEDGSKLMFPSGIFVNARTDSTEVILGKNVVLEGLLVVKGINRKDIKKRSIVIKENGHLYGDLYCNGNLELSGNVTGSVYVNSLSSKKDGSNSTNLLLNTTIDAINTEDIYPRLIFFKKGQKTIDVIKEL